VCAGSWSTDGLIFLIAQSILSRDNTSFESGVPRSLRPERSASPFVWLFGASKRQRYPSSYFLLIASCLVVPFSAVLQFSRLRMLWFTSPLLPLQSQTLFLCTLQSRSSISFRVFPDGSPSSTRKGEIRFSIASCLFMRVDNLSSTQIQTVFPRPGLGYPYRNPFLPLHPFRGARPISNSESVGESRKD